ncbi:ZCHC3 protein, partial [Amia calva]|nr:ZCHC3 protein [Amia calva]
MGFAPKDLNCLVKLPHKDKHIFEVSFANHDLLEEFYRVYRKEYRDLAGYTMIILSVIRYRIVTVQFFCEMVSGKDVEIWLARFSELSTRIVKVLDGDGVWGGAWQCRIRLRRSVENPEKVCHLPSTIQIGEARGLVYYDGMPKLCRRCHGRDHVVAQCTAVVCGKCKGGHLTHACREKILCNLCGCGGHIYKNCPDSYANRAGSHFTLTSNSIPDPKLEQEGGPAREEEGEAEEEQIYALAPEPPPTPKEPPKRKGEHQEGRGWVKVSNKKRKLVDREENTAKNSNNVSSLEEAQDCRSPPAPPLEQGQKPHSLLQQKWGLQSPEHPAPPWWT